MAVNGIADTDQYLEDMDEGHVTTGDQDEGHVTTGDQDEGHVTTGDQDEGHVTTGEQDEGHGTTGDQDEGQIPEPDYVQDEVPVPMNYQDEGRLSGGDRDEEPVPMNDQEEYVQSPKCSSPFVEEVVNHQESPMELYDANPSSPTQSYKRVPCGPVQPIADIRGVDTLNYRKGEKVLRCKVATCCRLVDIFGWSVGIHSFVSARIDKNIDQLLVPPHGMMCDEVTAASLVKVDFNGQVIDPGCTELGVLDDDVLLHSAVYSARSDLNCAIHIASPAAVSVSILKCGLLPLCQEAMVLGKISYHEYSGLVSEKSDRDELGQAFEPSSKVLFLRNFGVIVAGETIEEAFYLTNCVMTAIETQLNLIPFGLDNFCLPTDDILVSVNKVAREHPLGVNSKKHFRRGEVEFEALVRQLDNAGYCTGYISQDIGLPRTVRSHSTTEITQPSFSIYNEDRKLGTLQDRAVTPNIYLRTESAGPGSNKQRGTKWVVETGGLSKPRSASVKAIHVNQFAPLGQNPKELRDKVKAIRKEYFEDTITSGPQSSVLEGVTWEEARKIKQGHTVGGVDNVFVTAASRGIIQRDHQREALFYKNYTLGNPFENVTDYELEKYKEDVEKKTKKGTGGTESPANVERPSSTHTPAPPRGPTIQPESPAPPKTEPVAAAPVKPVVVAETQPTTPAAKPVLTPQMKQPASPESPASDSEPEKVRRIGELKDGPQRTQSARFPDRKPPTKKEVQQSIQKSESLRQPVKHAAGQDGQLDSPGSDGKEHHSSKENSPTRDISKEKKKKSGFKLFSGKKKEK